MRILILIASLMLAACATQNSGFSAEEARLRRSITQFALEGMVKYQSKVTAARNNAFTLVQTEPGHYELRLFDDQEVTRRNLNIQPTLTSCPSLPVRIIVNRDLALRPYQPLFFNRGISQ